MTADTLTILFFWYVLGWVATAIEAYCADAITIGDIILAFAFKCALVPVLLVIFPLVVLVETGIFSRVIWRKP